MKNQTQIIQDLADYYNGNPDVEQPPSNEEVQNAIDRLGDLEDAVQHIPFWGRVIKQMRINSYGDLARVLVRFRGPEPGTGAAKEVGVEFE